MAQPPNACIGFPSHGTALLAPKRTLCLHEVGSFNGGDLGEPIKFSDRVGGATPRAVRYPLSWPLALPISDRAHWLVFARHHGHRHAREQGQVNGVLAPAWHAPRVRRTPFGRAPVFHAAVSAPHGPWRRNRWFRSGAWRRRRMPAARARLDR